MLRLSQPWLLPLLLLLQLFVLQWRQQLPAVREAMAAYLLPSCCLVLMQRLHSRIQQISLATW